MAVREHCWSPVSVHQLVSVLVMVLVMVTVAGGAGPLLAVPPATFTVDFKATTVTPNDTIFTSTSAPVTTSSAAPSTTATSSRYVTTSSAGPSTTTTVEPCPDPHSQSDGHAGGNCPCEDRYRQTNDPEASKNNSCRAEFTGFLGAPCTDVSDCNYAIHHVVCDDTCQCRAPYVGFNGQTTCFDNAMGWGVAVKTAGITVLVLAVGFLLAFGIKGCSRSVRSRLGRRVPWLRRTSDISFRSGDFFVGSLSQAILDRPPSYAEEDTDKPPAYEEVFPERQEGVVNAGFSGDSAPTSPERSGQQGAAAETSTPQSVPTPQAGPAVIRPAVRGHRRGLSGPAAIHLGTAEQNGQADTAEPNRSQQSEQRAPAEPNRSQQSEQRAPAEPTSTVDPKETGTADTKQSSNIGNATSERTSRAATPQQTRQPPEQTSLASDTDTVSTVASKQTSFCRVDPDRTARNSSVVGPGQASGKRLVCRPSSDQTIPDVMVISAAVKSSSHAPASQAASAGRDPAVVVQGEQNSQSARDPSVELGVEAEVWEDIKL